MNNADNNNNNNSQYSRLHITQNSRLFMQGTVMCGMQLELRPSNFALKLVDFVHRTKEIVHRI